MRIISKQHDYYDRAMGHGHDDAIRYLRTRTELSATPTAVQELMVEASDSFKYDPVETRHGYFVFAPFMVAFCGKVYRGIRVQRLHRRARPHSGFECEETLFYAWPDLDAYLCKYKVSLPKETRYRAKVALDKRMKDYLAAQGTSDLEKFMLDERIVILTCFEAHKRYWFNNEIVAFCYSAPEYKVVVDDGLGSLGFGQVFDAYSAYQEIDMYVSGTLATNAPPPVELTEKERIVQHGFDKWSFRRQSESGK